MGLEPAALRGLVGTKASRPGPTATASLRPWNRAALRPSAESTSGLGPEQEVLAWEVGVLSMLSGEGGSLLGPV